MSKDKIAKQLKVLDKWKKELKKWNNKGTGPADKA